MTEEKPIVVIGAGFTGLAAAYELALAGKQVTIIERDAEVGGLAGTFELTPGYRVEKFYHHWFASDNHILDWLREVGAGDEIAFAPTNTGLYYANSIFRLATPFDLLRFTPLPLIDRVRTGLMALAARRITDWRALEDISAADWIVSHAGRKSYEVIWKPLLAGKFGIEAENISAVWFWNKIKLRGSSRNKQGGETLAYFRGGFTRAMERVVARLEMMGVEFRLSTAVHEIRSEQGKVSGVQLQNEIISAEQVLATVPLPIFSQITPGLSDEYRRKCNGIRFLGNVCLVLRLKRSLSSTYWLNVADPDFPYVGIIEHTNFDPPANYGGEHIAYLSKYLPTSEPMFALSDKELLDFSLPFIQKIFPEFQRDWIIGAHAWKAQYSQPVITKGYSALIPEHRTGIDGLYLATMAQVYPEDRGTNYAVREGRKVAVMMLEDGSS